MVKCIVRGKMCELGGGGGGGPDDEDRCDLFPDYHDEDDAKFKEYLAREYEESKMQKDYEELVVRTSKVLVEEFDEHGRPTLKIVYMDPIDWTRRSHLLNCRYKKEFIDKEREAAEDYLGDYDNGKPRRPRVIFVFQDKDYWPGTESDPAAMERRLAKERAIQESGLRPYGGSLDYKRVLLDSYDRLPSRNTAERYRAEYDNYFDPQLPGYSFLADNISEELKKSWKSSLDSLCSHARPASVRRPPPPTRASPQEEKEAAAAEQLEQLKPCQRRRSSRAETMPKKKQQRQN